MDEMPKRRPRLSPEDLRLRARPYDPAAGGITERDLDESTLTTWEEEEEAFWAAGDEEYDRRRDEMMDERRREREA